MFFFVFVFGDKIKARWIGRREPLVHLLAVVDRTFGDGVQEMRVTRTAQATIVVEVGDDPGRVFHGLLVKVTTGVGDLVGEVGVGAERESGDVGLDGVARVGGEAVVHVAELARTVELFVLVVAAGDTRGVFGHVNTGATGSREVAFEVGGPLGGAIGDDGGCHVCFGFVGNLLDEGEPV